MRGLKQKMTLSPFYRLTLMTVGLYTVAGVSGTAVGHVFDQLTGQSLQCPEMDTIQGSLDVFQCAARCMTHSNCSGFNDYSFISVSRTCELCFSSDVRFVNITTSDPSICGYLISVPPPVGYNCQTNNPCGAVEEFFPHEQPNKYIQCGNSVCYELSCPENLLWDQSVIRCV